LRVFPNRRLRARLAVRTCGESGGHVRIRCDKRCGERRAVSHCLTTALAKEKTIQNGIYHIERSWGIEFLGGILFRTVNGVPLEFIGGTPVASQNTGLLRWLQGTRVSEDGTATNRSDSGETDWLLAEDARTSSNEPMACVSVTEEIVEMTQMNYTSIFFVFNFGDWAGRALCACPRPIGSLDRPNALFLSIARADSINPALPYVQYIMFYWRGQPPSSRILQSTLIRVEGTLK